MRHFPYEISENMEFIKRGMYMNKKNRGILVFLIGLGIWFAPVPIGLQASAWHLFAIFAATIAGFILQPLPIGTIAFFSLTFTAATGVLSASDILTGFSATNMWLILSAFFFSRGLIKSGLGRRIAFKLIKCFGNKTLKLGYILALSDLLISPATPSNTARGGGIVFPVAGSLANAFDSFPGVTAKRMGAYLMQVGYQSNCITSAMFMTAMSGNPVIAMLALKAIGVELTWGTWALAGFIPGILSLLIMPYLLYKIDPPEVKHTPEAKFMAIKELEIMGPMSKIEKIVGVVFVGALIFWGTSGYTKIDATIIAMGAVSIMLLTEVLTWQDIMNEKGAWDTFIWMGSLVALANFLSKLGFIPWLAMSISKQLTDIPWMPTLLILAVVYVYSHYGFASMVAHIVAMYAAFTAVAVAAGVPPYLAALLLAFLSSLCGSLTHYAAGPAPIFFGAGYVEQNRWWKHGFIISILNLVLWISIGSVWWKFIGLW